MLAAAAAIGIAALAPVSVSASSGPVTATMTATGAASGTSITDAVGRDHRRWYDVQRPEPFAAGLRAAKAAVDPKAILNPGVLLDP